MKNSLNLFCIILIILTLNVKAQTNVSGSIYSNTTWTQANSPYIVTDTVVVYPNVTLTIEAGVTVKFADNMEIEVRLGQLVANGTSTDSITFTSNSLTPAAGIYPGIYLNGGNLTSTFNYCSFRWAKIGVNAEVSDSLIVNNSIFNQNLTGLQFNVSAEFASIDSSNFMNNTNTGLILGGLATSSVNYCNFTYNDTGLSNTCNTAITNCNFSNNSIGLEELNAATVSHCSFTFNGNGLYWSTQSSLITYCGFSNNTVGMQYFGFFDPLDAPYYNTMKNCIFDSNQTAAVPTFMLIDSCTIVHNQTGISSAERNGIKNCIIDSNSVAGIASAFTDTIVNCSLRYNGAAITGGVYSTITGNNISYNGSGIQNVSNSEVVGNDIEYNTGANIGGGESGTFERITGNTISYGSVGIDTISGSFSITQNTIENNGVGIILNSSNGTLSCNRICDNTAYNLKYFASASIDASQNYWCTADSASTQVLIYDVYDNINYGLVIFTPLDTVGCNLSTAIAEYAINQFIDIYPNPVGNQLSIHVSFLTNWQKATVSIMNMLGQETSPPTSLQRRGEDAMIDISKLSAGMYFLQLKSESGSVVKKFVKE